MNNDDLMRTTVNLDDDIYAAARNLAQLKRIALGEALSELARRGLERPVAGSGAEELPVFSVSGKARNFGLNEVRDSESEG